MNILTFSKEIDEFIKFLDIPTGAKVVRAVELLKHYEHLLGMPHSKKVAPHLFELRTRGRQQVRIFYCFHGGNAVLLHAFIKKSQATPAKELRLAADRFQSLTKR